MCLALLLAATESSLPLERLGTHAMLEVLDAPFDALNSTDRVLGALRAAAASGNLTVLGEHVHAFPVMGVSVLLLLSESHLSAHTWPERGYAAVDLFTCGPPSSLPCGEHRPARREIPGDWRCPDDRSVPAGSSAGGGLAGAVEAVLEGLGATGARLLWLERGLPPPPGERGAAPEKGEL